MSDYERLDDRGLLTYIAMRVKRIDDAVYGNGRPGLVADVAMLKERTGGRSKVKMGGFLASITAGVLAFLWNLRTAMG
jgi:hypothetical protein